MPLAIKKNNTTATTTAIKPNNENLTIPIRKPRTAQKYCNNIKKHTNTCPLLPCKYAKNTQKTKETIFSHRETGKNSITTRNKFAATIDPKYAKPNPVLVTT
ncbi:hypothetical protein GCM10028811_39550 [Uliginosibacterium sediminicola]